MSYTTTRTSCVSPCKIHLILCLRYQGRFGNTKEIGYGRWARPTIWYQCSWALLLDKSTSSYAYFDRQISFEYFQNRQGD
jgi:hypothetical protein